VSARAARVVNQQPKHLNTDSSQHTTPALAHSLTHSRCRTPSPPGLTPCLTLTGTSSGHPPLLVPNPGLVAPILFFLLKKSFHSSLLKNFVGNNCSLFTHSLTHSLTQSWDRRGRFTTRSRCQSSSLPLRSGSFRT
jgi:hypothetical protein